MCAVILVLPLCSPDEVTKRKQASASRLTAVGLVSERIVVNSLTQLPSASSDLISAVHLIWHLI